ncbi:MAG: sulfatase-like hydrolase/transferase, partial [Cyclobacteriaceae bacterium]|nr:sulfatase-like hydrolase/transferase [Cyclobacteriaceae bacterium]
APAPVCAPTRSSIITGVFANSLGTHQMRSSYPIPKGFKFYPKYLREAGYYCTNQSKEDYNTINQKDAWNESGKEASYNNRQEGQPFFHIYNFTISHESSVHKSIPTDELRHDPKKVPIPPYHPRTEAMEHDWAQYYDKVEDLDTKVGEVLAEIEEAGLTENTIIFYYSDHGGVLGRSKRFMYESGLKVPLIVSIPKKYQYLAEEMSGSTTDRFVNLLDMAPTVLNLIGSNIPDYMQGKPFLGKNTKKAESSFGFRGRMDERFDLVRTVRNKEYRYIKNYMPHRIYGQYIEYLWRAPSMKSWEQAYLNGELNETQSAFWKEKPAEELYNIKDDPHNINNLAADPELSKVLADLRKECQNWQRNIIDVGFIPEPMIERISADTPMYDYVRKDVFPFDRIMETANMATTRNPDHIDELAERLNDSNPIVRYWALVGFAILSDQANLPLDKIRGLINDEEISVRIVASEVLYKTGEKEAALTTLIDCLGSELMMARTMALNVLALMGEESRPALSAVQMVAGKTISGTTYDIRAAKGLIDYLSKN